MAYGKAFALAGVAGLAMVAQAPAAAQDAPERAAVDGGEAEDIIVTARKREERLEDVPLSITVVGQEAITRGNLNNISDVAQQTPGLSFKQGFGRIGGGGGAGVRPSIRGMSSVVGAPNAAFFVDGIFVSDNISSYQLDNLERIEVIKGPQSALFGRQTFSGAINYVRRKPTNDWDGRIRLSAGEYDYYEASAYVSGPIVRDVLKFEVNGRYYNFGGDWLNADNGKRELGAQRSYNLGGRLVFTPGNNFEAIASVGYSNDRDKGYVYGFQGSAKNNCFAPPIVATIPFPRTPSARRGFFCGPINTLGSYAYNNDELEALGYHGLDREFWRTSLQMTYTGDGGWSATSITAFNRNDSITGQDNTLRPSTTPSFSIDGNNTQDWSQEVRVMSPQQAPIRGLFGGYYYEETTRDGFSVNTATNMRRPFSSEDGVESKALFGMLEAELGSRFTVSAEARYQWETITGSTEVLGTPGSPPPPATGIREAKFEAFLPRFTARYEMNDQVNIYATAAKGNKPGGFNNFPTDAVPADLAEFEAAGLGTFGEETAWTFELGSKGRVGALNYGLAVFYTDWQNQQLSRGESYTRLSGLPNSVVFIQNAGASEIKGFEIELNARPARWLFARVGYTFVDARFTDFYDDTTEEIFDTDGRPARLPDGSPNPADVDGLSGGDLKDNRLPQTPQHQLVLTAQVNAPLSDRLEFVARTDLSFESKRYVQVDNLNWASDSTNVNLNLALEANRWSLSAWARNLFDDRTPLVVTRLLDFNRLLTRRNPLTGANQTTFFRDFAVSAPRKRQFGVTLQYKFGS
jgi:outer membrane receptor protein involved in Fe transport